MEIRAQIVSVLLTLLSVDIAASGAVNSISFVCGPSGTDSCQSAINGANGGIASVNFDNGAVVASDKAFSNYGRLGVESFTSIAGSSPLPYSFAIGSVGDYITISAPGLDGSLGSLLIDYTLNGTITTSGAVSSVVQVAIDVGDPVSMVVQDTNTAYTSSTSGIFRAPRTFTFTFGQPFGFSLCLGAATGTGIVPAVLPTSGHISTFECAPGKTDAGGVGSGTADFFNTLTLSGLTVTDSFGNPVSGVQFTSTSGTQYGPNGVEPAYTFTSLLFPGAGNTSASGINNAGTIVGFPAAAQSFVFQNGTYTTLAVPGSVFTSANGINDLGFIVGEYSSTGFGNSHGFILQGPYLFDIDFPGASATRGTSAVGINSSDEIVGFYTDNNGSVHGFIRERDNFAAIDVPFPGATDTRAMGINDSVAIVGSYTGSDGQSHGFIRQAGAFQQLDVLFPGVTSTIASGINNKGQIVGYYVDGSGRHGFIFSNGVFTRLDVSFPGIIVTGTAPAGINDLGEIVGSYSTSQSVFGFLAKP